MKCDYDVKEKPSGRRIIVNCIECEVDFDLKRCYPQIVSMMSMEYNIDNIIFSDHKETMIKGDAVRILSNLGTLSRELKRLSLRKTNESKCKDCKVSPKILFSELDNKIKKDPQELFKTYKKIAFNLMKADDCPKCRKTTKEDLERIGGKFITISNDVKHKAYGIIG
ncbi:MAG: hypothetical protein R6U17_01410 [Thermoplasmata archaeon]